VLHRNNGNKASANDTYDPDQIGEIINVCGIEIGSELDTHYLVFCPFHYNKNTPACEVDKEKGLFLCFACGERGTLLDLVMRTTNRNYFEASRVISTAAKSIDFASRIEKDIQVKEEFLQFDNELIDRLHNDLLSSEKAIAYFKSRNIELDAIKKFKLGYSPKQDMVTVPVYSHTDICVGFVGRSIEGKSFKNSTGLPRNKVLFNLNSVKFKDIVIVESSFDAIRLWQLNIPAIATLGANIGKNQINLINKYATRLILAMDQDEAGGSLTRNLNKSVTVPILNMDFPDGVKDIGDMKDEEIVRSFNSLKSLDLALLI
jgi:DNA primase